MRIFDTFPQADENPLSGGGQWNAGSGYPGCFDMKVVSNQVNSNDATGSDAIATFGLTPFGNDQFAQITLKTWNAASGSFGGVLLRAAAPGSTTYYFVAAGTVSTGVTTIIRRLVAGSGATLTSENATTWVVGDILLASIRESTISVFRNGAPLLTFTDTTPINSGTVGLFASVNATTDVGLDDFIGGDFYAARRKTYRPRPFAPGIAR